MPRVGGGGSWLRWTVVLLLVAAAYGYSLFTLAQAMGQETPLAYLGLVPCMALLLGFGVLHRPYGQTEIHDRYVDYIVGLTLLGAALGLLLLGPVFLSTFFWLWRLDLLSLPLFVAGAITLCFGIRMSWRLRLPISFLWLAWPPLYSFFLNSFLGDTSQLTLGALRGVIRVIPLATPAVIGDGSIFVLQHGTQSFTVSVASACSGVNSVLGFLLVGLVAQAFVSGPRWRKAAWLVGGMAVIWGLDVLRILLIFASADMVGEGFAVDVLHPVVGLCFFSLGLLAMLWVMPRLGLRVLSWSPRAPQLGRAPRPVRRAGVALLLCAVAAGGAFVSDSQMGHYQLLSEDLGPSLVAPQSVSQATLPGWTGTAVASYSWVTLYFGSGSSWRRYSFTGAGQGPAVTMDVISTADLGSLGTYTVQACYDFHSYQMISSSQVALGGGLEATAASYRMPNHEVWSAVYWEWPVQGAGGQSYQRVVLDQTGQTAATGLTSFARNLVGAVGRSVVSG